MNIQQFIGDGLTLEFSFSFKIPKGGLVNVYKTLSGNNPDETNDLIPSTDYNLVYTDVDDNFTDGKVTFNIAPSNGDYITITPLPNGNTDIDFTAQNELSADNLNLAFARHTVPINYSFGLYNDRSVRYDINVKQNEVSSYNTLLPSLADQAFWRRSGSTMISQPYDDFVTEVSNSITNFKNELEQVTITNQTGTTFSLSDFTSGDISQTTLEVFKNGLKLSITGDYSVDSTNNTITLITPLIISDYIYITKPLVKESNTFMDDKGDNAIFSTNTKIADRSLTNVNFTNDTLVANKDLSNVTLPIATISNKGIAEIATQLEVNSGTDNEMFITPLTLKNTNISIGSGQSYSALSTPTLNADYTNNTGRSIFVIITGLIKIGSGYLQIKINDNPITSPIIYSTNSTGSLDDEVPFSFSFVVPNNAIYYIETNIHFDTDGKIEMSVLS